MKNVLFGRFEEKSRGVFRFDGARPMYKGITCQLFSYRSTHPAAQKRYDKPDPSFAYRVPSLLAAVPSPLFEVSSTRSQAADASQGMQYSFQLARPERCFPRGATDAPLPFPRQGRPYATVGEHTREMG